jgi:hypothetical protein
MRNCNFSRIANKFSDLDKRADDALQQIEDKKYVQELNDDGYATPFSVE